jgi:ABC-type Mn2+/Zn2+ transport system ATPase subunit
MASSVAASTLPLIAESATVTTGSQELIRDVTMHVAPAQIVCLLGPNGGGKTTFLKAALGLLPLTSGRIALFGETPETARTGVGYVPQRQTFDRSFPATASELIVAHLRGRWPMRVSAAERELVRAALERVSGASLLDRPIASLSGGESQRVFLARALVRAPRLLLLDEPMAGMGAEESQDMVHLLRRLKARCGMLLIEHDMDAVFALADRITVLVYGRAIASGTPEEIRANAEVRRAYLGEEVA